MRLHKAAARAGILGTVLFTFSFMLNGSLRPGYDPVHMYVSELSIGSEGWIQIMSFMLFGIALFLFALGLKAVFPTGRASRSGPILLMAIGIGYFLSGPFVTDPAAMFDNQQTLHGVLHGIFGAFVFSLSAAVCFVYWRRFRIDEAWKSLSIFSLICGIVVSALIVCMKIGQLQDGLLSDWAGVVQRICLITSYIWIFTVSAKMSRVQI